MLPLLLSWPLFCDESFVVVVAAAAAASAAESMMFVVVVVRDDADILFSAQTVVPSAISSEDDSDYQTFDVAVHTNMIRLLPKFGQITDLIGIKEVGSPKRKDGVLVPLFGR